MNLSIQDLSVRLNAQNILDGLNVEFEGDGTITVLGSSGIGKTTLLRAISGLKISSAQSIDGNIFIEGMSPNRFLETGDVGFMFQEPSLLPNMTVVENVKLPLMLQKRDVFFAEELVQNVGLEEYKDFLPSELSGGMRTRVSLARTLSTRPKLLLLDEPFSSLDFGWKHKLYRELTRLKSEYPAMSVLVTHDIEEALLLSDKIVILGRSGKIEMELEIKASLDRLFSQNPFSDLADELNELRNYFINEKSNNIG